MCPRKGSVTVLRVGAVTLPILHMRTLSLYRLGSPSSWGELESTHRVLVELRRCWEKEVTSNSDDDTSPEQEGISWATLLSFLADLGLKPRAREASQEVWAASVPRTPVSFPP